MIVATRMLVALAVAGFFAAPLRADVIPTRYDEADPGAARKVEARLEDLGMSAPAAGLHARQLTGEETAFFAERPERLQRAGQEIFGGQSDNFWWEWLFGAAALAGAGTLIYFIAFD